MATEYCSGNAVDSCASGHQTEAPDLLAASTWDDLCLGGACCISRNLSMLENSNLTYTLTGPPHHDYVQMLPPPHCLPSHHQPPRRKKPRPGQAQPFHPAPEAPRLPRLCAISSCIHCRRQHVTDPLPPPSPPVGTQKGPALSPSRPPNVVIRRARVAPHHRKRRWNCSRHGCTTHNCQMSFVRLYLYPARCGRTVGWWWVAAHDDARGQNRPRSPSFWPLHVGECFLPVCGRA